MNNFSNNQLIIGIVTVIAIILILLNIYKNKIGEETSIAITITILLFGGAIIYGIITNNKSIHSLLNNLEGFDNELYEDEDVEDEDVEDEDVEENENTENFSNLNSEIDSNNTQQTTQTNNDSSQLIFDNLLFAPTKDIMGQDTKINSTSNSSFDIRCSVPIPKNNSCNWLSSQIVPDSSRNTLEICENHVPKISL